MVWTVKHAYALPTPCDRQSLDEAYSPYIQRLMVTGNFALLAGLAEELHRWYLGVYIDAFEWVERSVTVGMSQFADGDY